MRLVIVTGMSGAGKSTAMKMLEDAQYFCVDNLPIQLVGKFVSLVSANKGEDVQNAELDWMSAAADIWRGWKKYLTSLKQRDISSRSFFLMQMTAHWSNDTRKQGEHIRLP